MRIKSWGIAKTFAVTFGLALIGFFAWLVSEDWRYSKFPNSCPVAQSLPANAVATKCKYDGLIDFSVDFQATGSRSDMAHFIDGIQNGLSNPRLDGDATNSITGAALNSEDRIQIRADHGVSVYFESDQGVITMFYHDG
ncbi:hypothetical protein [Loktanella sp. Alg231-35]|uniref:hypothetical protein n=1 Tax=Loktanella sp. Alg231-35 TaxID=1922220 RepID=UPI000D54E288|nr:hypothetical protein [Loktanella sp. Alg231-35]